MLESKDDNLTVKTKLSHFPFMVDSKRTHTSVQGDPPPLQRW